MGRGVDQCFEDVSENKIFPIRFGHDCTVDVGDYARALAGSTRRQHSAADARHPRRVQLASRIGPAVSRSRARQPLCRVRTRSRCRHANGTDIRRRRLDASANRVVRDLLAYGRNGGCDLMPWAGVCGPPFCHPPRQILAPHSENSSRALIAIWVKQMILFGDMTTLSLFARGESR
jgi:hypothetical protein